MLTLATWADLIRLWRKADTVAASVSLLTLVAVLVYCRVPDVPAEAHDVPDPTEGAS